MTGLLEVNGEDIVSVLRVLEMNSSPFFIFLMTIFTLGIYLCCRRRLVTHLVLTPRRVVYFSRTVGARGGVYEFWQSTFFVNRLCNGEVMYDQVVYRCMDYLCCTPLCHKMCCKKTANCSLYLNFEGEENDGFMPGSNKVTGFLTDPKSLAYDIACKLAVTKKQNVQPINRFLSAMYDLSDGYTLEGKPIRSHFKRVMAGSLYASSMDAEKISISMKQVPLGHSERVIDAIAVTGKVFQPTRAQEKCISRLKCLTCCLIVPCIRLYKDCSACSNNGRFCLSKVRRNYICVTDRRIFQFNNAYMKKQYRQHLQFFMVQKVTSAGMTVAPANCCRGAYSQLDFSLFPSSKLSYSLARVSEERMSQFFLSCTSSPSEGFFEDQVPMLPELSDVRIVGGTNFTLEDLLLPPEKCLAAAPLLPHFFNPVCVPIILCCSCGSDPRRMKGSLVLTTHRLIEVRNEFQGTRLRSVVANFWWLVGTSKVKLSNEGGRCCQRQRLTLSAIFDDIESAGDLASVSFDLAVKGDAQEMAEDVYLYLSSMDLTEEDADDAEADKVSGQVASVFVADDEDNELMKEEVDAPEDPEMEDRAEKIIALKVQKREELAAAKASRKQFKKSINTVQGTMRLKNALSIMSGSADKVKETEEERKKRVHKEVKDMKSRMKKMGFNSQGDLKEQRL